jgi:hypothetical protein
MDQITPTSCSHDAHLQVEMSPSLEQGAWNRETGEAGAQIKVKETMKKRVILTRHLTSKPNCHILLLCAFSIATSQ